MRRSVALCNLMRTLHQSIARSRRRTTAESDRQQFPSVIPHNGQIRNCRLHNKVDWRADCQIGQAKDPDTRLIECSCDVKRPESFQRTTSAAASVSVSLVNELVRSIACRRAFHDCGRKVAMFTRSHDPDSAAGLDATASNSHVVFDRPIFLDVRRAGRNCDNRCCRPRLFPKRFKVGLKRVGHAKLGLRPLRRRGIGITNAEPA